MKKELIGLDIEIAKAANNSLVGIKGRVIDETKNTLLIKTGKGEKRVIKKQATFLIKGSEIDGKKLAKRPEERIK